MRSDAERPSRLEAGLPAPPPGGLRLLEWFRTSGVGLAALASAWALFLLSASQLPQGRAPQPVSDGLARGDWLMIEALGLDNVGSGLPLWLLFASSIAFGGGVWWLARHERRGGTTTARARQPVRRLAVLAAALAWFAWLAATVATSLGPAPRWLELPIVADTHTTSSMPPLLLERGQGRWHSTALAAGGCRVDGAAYVCQLPEGGERSVRVGASPELRDGRLWTLRGAQSGADVSRGRLELDEGRSGQGRVGFEVSDERATIVPALQARVALVATRRSGPVATMRVADGASTLLAGPGLALGAPGTRLRSVERLRVVETPLWPSIAAALAAVLALIAAVAGAFAGRSASVERATAPLSGARQEQHQEQHGGAS